MLTAAAPPASYVPGIFTTLLSVLPLLPLPDHIDQVVSVLMALVKRDEQTSEGKLQLGDKLVKWLAVEVDKATNGVKITTSGALSPYLFAILGLLTTLHSTRSSAFTSTPQFGDLLVSLGTVLDSMEARSHLGKETTRDARFRRKVGIRTWRCLRSVSPKRVPYLIRTAARGVA